MSLLFLSLLAPPAAAAELPMAPAEMCRRSTRVVVAEVTTTETYWGDDDLIRTHTWFTVLADLKPVQGPVPDDVELDLAGGTIGDLTLRGGNPTFTVDHVYVLHLTVAPDETPILTSTGGVTPLGAAPDAATLGSLAMQTKEVCRAR